ncbi:jg7023 [Pararge aegeria aegeria]|uniref:Jg7023 protein n=1 Tax=Pararge aegeria aegeria TaxID=348720 RepID=A0A8S4RK71_9NEOP|nr:jg7023 [Pararge aegeria aegeria]
MYAKTHVALNKVNSYEKAGFHSGTPPPFGAGSHLYIPAPPHHHPHHHAPQQHQMDGRVNSSHNRRVSYTYYMFILHSRMLGLPKLALG